MDNYSIADVHISVPQLPRLLAGLRVLKRVSHSLVCTFNIFNDVKLFRVLLRNIVRIFSLHLIFFNLRFFV